ncbi:MAG: RNA polymerase sigma factor [Armatimonadetes bacterium]|nr:sigma-70 family RNA polymerase sigma factor [Armatimonadota bacterium]MBS1703488.1 RNA polymerase sigma factor [Armatimonadota bacterium]
MLQIAVAQPGCAAPGQQTRSDYERFLASHLPRLNSLAFSYTRPDHELAKDIVQEAVIKGYQAYMNRTLCLDNQAKAWFATVIRNEFLMHKRKNKRIAGPPDEQTPGIDGRREFENVGLRDVLTRAIDELPDDQRECVVLVDIHQFDYEETAAILQIAVGTVRSRLSRARMKLASRLNSLECTL